MIQYAPDGVTLVGHFPDSKEFSHSIMEGKPYNDMLEIRDAQLQAIRENTQAKANYETALANAQLNVDAGHAMAAPTKPSMKVVDDLGAVTFHPFDPPLGDLKAPTAAVPPAPGVGGVKRDTSGDTQQAVMFAMIQAIFRKMFPGA